MRKTADNSPGPFHPVTKPLLIVLSGPSGVGKDAVLTRFKESDYPLTYIVTLTTRQRRPNEKDGIDYHFISTARFQEMIANGDLLEWAEVYGNWYGVPREKVRQSLSRGRDTMVKVDIQGAASIKEILPEAVFLCLMPPSAEALRLRLEQRHTESDSDLALRLETAAEEMKQLSLFDYVVINRWDEIDLAVADIKAILTAEKLRVTPREVRL